MKVNHQLKDLDSWLLWYLIKSHPFQLVKQPIQGPPQQSVSVPRLDSPPKSRHVPGFKDSYHMAIFSRPWPLWKCSRFWCRIICVWNVLWSAPPRPLGGDDPFRDGLKHIGNKESSVLLFSEIFISNGPT